MWEKGGNSQTGSDSRTLNFLNDTQLFSFTGRPVHFPWSLIHELAANFSPGQGPGLACTLSSDSSYSSRSCSLNYWAKAVKSSSMQELKYYVDMSTENTTKRRSDGWVHVTMLTLEQHWCKVRLYTLITWCNHTNFYVNFNLCYVYTFYRSLNLPHVMVNNVRIFYQWSCENCAVGLKDL